MYRMSENPGSLNPWSPRGLYKPAHRSLYVFWPFSQSSPYKFGNFRNFIYTLTFCNLFLKKFVFNCRQDKQCTYNRNMEAVSRNRCCSEKAKSIHISLCVCACIGGWVNAWVFGVSVLLRACSLTDSVCKAPPYCHLRPLSLHLILPHSHKRHDFTKKVIEHNMCVLIFYTPFTWNVSHSKKNAARYCNKCENVFI